MNVSHAVLRTVLPLLALLSVAGCGDAADDAGAASPVVATVDGQPITQADIDLELRLTRYQGRELDEATLIEARQQYGKVARESLIERQVLANAADAEGIEAPAEEIEKRWAALKMRIPPDRDMNAFLASKGYTVDLVNETLALDLRARALLEKHVKHEPVTDEAVRAIYEKHAKSFATPEQVLASHILLNVPSGASDEDKEAVKKKIEGIRAQIVEQGIEQFPTLAAEHSACPTGKQAQGSLGWFGRGRMVREFDKVAFDMEPGVVSEPVLTQFGWHLLLVQDKREASVRPLEEVQGQIRSHLEAEARKEAEMAYLDGLRKAAKVVHLVPAPEPAPRPSGGSPVWAGGGKAMPATKAPADAPKQPEPQPGK